jgi:hypothetical protein
MDGLVESRRSAYHAKEKDDLVDNDLGSVVTQSHFNWTLVSVASDLGNRVDGRVA